MCKTMNPLVNSASMGVTNTRGIVKLWWLFTTLEGSNGEEQHTMVHAGAYTWVVLFLVLWMLCLLCLCCYLCRGSLQGVITGIMSCLKGEQNICKAQTVPIAQMVSCQREISQMVTHIPEKPPRM